ncbi:MAG: hypothetical protein AAFO83_11520, partial [Cyanobacteria bacterium J06607_13]
AEAARSGVVAQLLAETDAVMIEALVAAVEKGQAAGDIDGTLAPEATTHLLMMMVDGFVGRLAITTDWDVEAIARQVEVAVFKLLATPVM